ncbi:hypothetical protein BD311DRAFT_754729 [Dichomitus squalens]|uniref:Secreted protein n=1 Tax=Dichomitus squalens TaxID=114155 RepID=A0A4Q9PBZ0_9APHY|nr:hypothetical protein BD311DRAFT_754729 [Dichomitus squalens]TBU52294.1 hypothetical protein BD310DRAFT_940596 [Dichomitus squalens]
MRLCLSLSCSSLTLSFTLCTRYLRPIRHHRPDHTTAANSERVDGATRFYASPPADIHIKGARRPRASSGVCRCRTSD